MICVEPRVPAFHNKVQNFLSVQNLAFHDLNRRKFIDDLIKCLGFVA